MRRRTWRPAATSGVRSIAVLGALASVVVAALQGWGSPAWYALPLLAVAVAASELAVVHLQFGRQRWTFSLTEGALGAAWVAWTA